VIKRKICLAAMVVLPLTLHTGYLLWIWPRPEGMSLLAQVGPYAVSLLSGLPFAACLARPRTRLLRLSAFVVVGFAFLWIYSLAVLCAVRGVCL
jgi:hypothetical protein